MTLQKKDSISKKGVGYDADLADVYHDGGVSDVVYFGHVSSLSRICDVLPLVWRPRALYSLENALSIPR